ncbi:DUF4097 family beta strand repeat-containing protein [Streptomyces spongiae]|uniref:DUF4097 domain-containing protein n=1 Tax=Streptomyces spongiae TaxID=565072 RepID=A0A5N8XXP2_9ACTN|nr:DUF4097 family beta strand repeat-containing protein [Streptomyces spongiae]MPY63838.1 DUF4097 domain-containing protein [Streptomyces spongiae]
MARTGRARAVAVSGTVVALMAGAVACGASAGDDKDPEQRSFALQGRTLTVDNDDSALELVPADVDEVEVTRWFSGSVVVGGDPRVTWEMKDDRLKLRMKCSGFVADCSARHRIEVPRGVAVIVKDGDGSVTAKGFKEALTIRTGDGSVRVADSTGPLAVRTGDGSVRVSDTTGGLEVHTGDGSVRATGIESRKVRTSTGDGSVRLELGVVPDLVDSRSGDGSISIGLPREKYRVTTETGDGSVDVSVPRDESSDHVVAARTKDGSVTVRTLN